MYTAILPRQSLDTSSSSQRSHRSAATGGAPRSLARRVRCACGPEMADGADQKGVRSEDAPAQPGQGVAADGSATSAGPGGVLGYLFHPSLDDDDMEIWLQVKRPYLIHPETGFNSIWDLMSMVLIIYSCITIPYRLCFDVVAEGWVIPFDKFVDSVFMFDCALTFRKCFWGEEGLVADPGQIASSYLRGWFVLDFFSSFPFDSVLAMTGSSDSPDSARILKVIRIFRMVKILRMVRIKRLLKKAQDDMGIKNGIMISLKFTMFTCFAAHFQACLWFYMSNSDPADNWALRYCTKADAVNYDPSCGDTVCAVVTCTERVEMLGIDERLSACPILASKFGSELAWNTSDAVSDTSTCGEADDCWEYAEETLGVSTEEYYGARRWFPDGTLYPSTGGVQYLYQGRQDSGVRASCPGGCAYSPPLRTACVDECNSCDAGAQYTTSFYWSIVTLTTLGYGDIGPANHFERMFGVYAMLLGASIFAYSVTNMCTLVHNLNPADVYNRTRLDELNQYLGFLSAPEELGKRCQDFFLYKINQSGVVVYNQDLILQDMSKTMQEDVRLQQVHLVVYAVPFFENQDQPFMRAIAVRMDTDPLSPGQVVVSKGQVITKMYIVGKGSMSLETTPGEGQRSADTPKLGELGIYGIGALFRPTKSGFKATTVDYVDMYALSKYHFDEALQLCDKDKKEFEELAISKNLLQRSPEAEPAPQDNLLAGNSIPVDRLRQQIQAQANLIKLLMDSNASD